jgi:hypothetical protein
VWRGIDIDDAVRVVVVRGEGSNFFRWRFRHDRSNDRGRGHLDPRMEGSERSGL